MRFSMTPRGMRTHTTIVRIEHSAPPPSHSASKSVAASSEHLAVGFAPAVRLAQPAPSLRSRSRSSITTSSATRWCRPACGRARPPPAPRSTARSARTWERCTGSAPRRDADRDLNLQPRVRGPHVHRFERDIRCSRFQSFGVDRGVRRRAVVHEVRARPAPAGQARTARPSRDSTTCCVEHRRLLQLPVEGAGRSASAVAAQREPCCCSRRG